MLSDGFGNLSDDVEEMIASREAMLRATAIDACRFDPASMPDILQEGKVAFWKTFSSLEGEPLDKRTAFAMTAAKYRMRNLQNPERHERFLSSEKHNTGTSEVKRVLKFDAPMSEGSADTYGEVLLGAADALEGVEWAYHRGEILQALNALPEAHREYVYLRFWQGYTDTEIAAFQGLSSSKVLYNRWSRTIRPQLVETLAHLSRT